VLRSRGGARHDPHERGGRTLIRAFKEREHQPEKVDPASFDYAAEDAALASR
jgi:hypothetical protein